ncbi:MAG: HEPN domain-containing protein [Candidatus Omnitrophica bacterium]|nr:HEPN domain-containing protein [Candidatus Omnitrophota bacterium]
MNSKFNNYPTKPASPRAFNAYMILCSTHDAASSFFDIFERRRRRKTKGTSTDEEQDLLRAMLVFATSGLDSMIKQLITDALHQIIIKDVGAREVFKNYIEKKLIQSNQINAKLLAASLVEQDPRKRLVDEVVRDLTSNSLQSKEELLRAASFFDIPSQDLSSDPNRLKEIFDARNQISHEMDINFSQRNRKRRQRKQSDMIRYTNEILRIAKTFLSIVDKKLIA